MTKRHCLLHFLRHCRGTWQEHCAQEQLCSSVCTAHQGCTDAIAVPGSTLAVGCYCPEITQLKLSLGQTEKAGQAFGS